MPAKVAGRGCRHEPCRMVVELFDPPAALEQKGGIERNHQGVAGLVAPRVGPKLPLQRHGGGPLVQFSDAARAKLIVVRPAVASRRRRSPGRVMPSHLLIGQ